MHNVRRFAKLSVAPLAAFITLLLLPGEAHASTGGPALPWDQGVQVLVDNVSGPLISALVIAAIVASGAVWAFTEHQQGFRRLSLVVMGGSVGIGAVNFASALGILGCLA